MLFGGTVRTQVQPLYPHGEEGMHLTHNVVTDTSSLYIGSCSLESILFKYQHTKLYKFHSIRTHLDT